MTQAYVQSEGISTAIIRHTVTSGFVVLVPH